MVENPKWYYDSQLQIDENEKIETHNISPFWNEYLERWPLEYVDSEL